MGWFGKRRNTGSDGTTLFFATDLHGSDVCFKKFVKAAEFYGADVLVLGGDVTGKLVVPIVDQGDGRWAAEVHGKQQVVKYTGLDDFEAQLANEGVYTRRMTREEHAGCERDPEQVDALFLELMIERLAHWIDLAHERLAGTSVRIMTAPGNDDPYEIDEVIRERGGDRVVLTEGEVVEVAPGHEMLNTGWSNPTPWHTHREFDEPVLRDHIAAMAGQLTSPASAIFNIHVPPYDTSIDTAPSLDGDLRVRTSMGAQITAPVGSTAVRDALETYQPLVSLHGHVHESGGSARVGGTLAINPGSEYGEGILHGALVTVSGGELRRFQPTTG